MGSWDLVGRLANYARRHRQGLADSPLESIGCPGRGVRDLGSRNARR